MTFNGGKQLHIFKISDNIYQNDFFSDESKEAFEKGIYYIKIDGSNGYFQDGLLYERYDDRKGKLNPNELPEGYMTIPNGENSSYYEKHKYYYKLLNKNVTEKKLKKMYNNLYSQVEDSMKNGSIEYIGPKYQATPGFTKDLFVFHRNLTIEISPQIRTYESLKEYLLSGVMEGVVIEHKGKYWKIRANVFDKNCKYERFKKAWLNRLKGRENTDEENVLLEENT
jgi:hypothetical protein